VFLTDGVVNLALLKFKDDVAAQGTGKDYVGLHHLVLLHRDYDRLSVLPPWLERAAIVTGPGPRSQLSGDRGSSKNFSADAGRRCTRNTQMAQCGS
jgi:hypothetical protein